jgi:small conductance mechanosensitive channel
MNNEAFVAFAESAFYALFIGIVGYILGVLAGQFIKYLVTRFIEPSWSNFAANLARLVAFVWTGQLMLQETGAAGLFVILATALTGAVAMGSERLASDTVSGMRLLMNRNYKVGDLITIADQEGEVMEITLTSTILKTDERSVVIVPNSLVADEVLTNHTAISGMIATVTIPVPLDQDIDKVTQIFWEAIKQFSPQEEAEGCDPNVFLSDAKNNIYYFTLKIYIPDQLDTEEVESQLRKLALKGLLEQGIPFAPQEVH